MPEEDMRKTFNMGIGYIIVVSGVEAEKTIALLKKSGYRAFVIGRTEKGGKGVRYS